VVSGWETFSFGKSKLNVVGKGIWFPSLLYRDYAIGERRRRKSRKGVERGGPSERS